jgi:hypothetical protein
MIRSWGPKGLQPVLRSRQVVSVEDLDLVTGQEGLCRPTQFADESGGLPSRVKDQFPGGGWLHMSKLVVQSPDRDGDLILPLFVSLMDRGGGSADDKTHQIDDGREKEFPLVLRLGRAGEEFVELGRSEDVLKGGSAHHTEGGFLNEAVKHRLTNHGRLLLGNCLHVPTDSRLTMIPAHLQRTDL